MDYIKIPQFDGEWGSNLQGAKQILIFDGNPALGMFDLKYLNGDHHVNTIGVGFRGADPSSYIFALQDKDYGVFGLENDSNQLRSKYVDITSPHFTSESFYSISGTSTNKTIHTHNINPIDEDKIFVLRGFYFKNTENSNHHLREIGVWLNPSTSSVNLSFVDNSPSDDEYFYQVDYYILKHFRDTSDDMLLKINGPFTEEFTFVEQATIDKSQRGFGLISGFQFRFLDNDHHFERISVDVSDFNDLTVAFTDSQKDHEVHCKVDYITLHEPDQKRYFKSVLSTFEFVLYKVGIMTTSIKVIESKDFNREQVLELYRLNNWSSADKPDLLLKALNNSDSLILAYFDDKLVGLGNAISDGFLVVYYPHLLVHPDYQGMGIGRKIMKCFQEKYGKFHQQMLTADSDSVAFYEKCGFEKAGKTQPMWIYSGNEH